MRNKKATVNCSGFLESGVPTGIRTPVTAVKGRCPRPLDDRDLLRHTSENNNKYWRPYGDSNPGYRRERAMS